MSDFIKGPPGGFPPGRTVITEIGEPEDDTGIEFAIHVLEKGETRFEPEDGREIVFLLMRGEAEIRFSGEMVRVSRSSLFDEPPSTLSAPNGVCVEIDTLGERSEWAVMKAVNGEFFDPVFYPPAAVENERRGKGLLDDASHRIVRTVFDKRNAPDSALVLGEVVNFPGRWSSYPPHHHPHPEIYHYRFLPEHGYGHAELGEKVYKVRHGDTVKILNGTDHPQSAAPGYAMHYLWVIRHLPDNPYIAPEFTPEHKEVYEPGFRMWKSKDF